jgi:hypothetical protein
MVSSVRKKRRPVVLVVDASSCKWALADDEATVVRTFGMNVDGE